MKNLYPLLFSIVVHEELIRLNKKRMKTLKFGYCKLKQMEIIELMFADNMAIVSYVEKNLKS